MKATVEPVEGNKVKLSIQVDSAEFEPQVDAAFKRYGVNREGFRETANVLRLLAGAGLGEHAAAIAARLRAEYPTRDALLEALTGM